MMINGIKVTAQEGIAEHEIAALVAEEKELWAAKGKQLGEIVFNLRDEDIEVQAFERSNIKRIRRITGYLSTQERFNDAKKSELADRSVHA